MRNEALQYLRHEQLLSTEQLTGVEVDIPEDEYNETELMELKARLKSALDKLPTQEYQAVKSVILENRKYISSIAEYRKLLQSCENEMPQMVGAVWHNLGTAYARLFLFEQAAD